MQQTFRGFLQNEEILTMLVNDGSYNKWKKLIEDRVVESGKGIVRFQEISKLTEQEALKQFELRPATIGAPRIHQMWRIDTDSAPSTTSINLSNYLKVN